jgi:hypothetical protein
MGRRAATSDNQRSISGFHLVILVLVAALRHQVYSVVVETGALECQDNGQAQFI